MLKMRIGTLVTVAVLASVVALQMMSPIHAGASTASSGSGLVQVAGIPTASAPVAHASTLAAASSASGYARTVLVETFTGQWCQYCEMESQALYAIEHQTTTNAIAVAELHECYSTATCGDNYITADNTSMVRQTYYGVYAYPTVTFDGGHTIVGAGSTLASLESTYNAQISAASQVPGNVSIVQSGILSSPRNVTTHATITSAIDGTFKAITYLAEFIGTNDSTGHDIEWVVRSSVVDQTVTLTAGGSVDVGSTITLGSGWNDHHLAVITFVQNYTSKVVENANFATVTTLTTGITASPTTIYMEHNSTVTVQVANSSTSTSLAGAEVGLTTPAGGQFTPAIGFTDANGVFTSVYTSPFVTDLTTVTVTATVNAAGYTAGSASVDIVVNPVASPTAPLGLTIAPDNGGVMVSWTAPNSGGSGVTYHVYRSILPTSGFSEIGVSTTTSYLDAAVTADQSYWYEVSAANLAGFSGNSTTLSASAVLASSQGLPSNVGWWLSIDNLQFTSQTNASIALHLPVASYIYTYGPGSYAYVAGSQSGDVAVAAGGQTLISAAFTPRYALFQGTVLPGDANVTLGGTPIAVSGGVFSQLMAAGTYTLVVSSADYETNTSTVTLTPANTTTRNVELTPTAPSGSQPATSGGLTSVQAGLIIGGVLVGAIALVVVALKLPRKGQGTRRAPTRPPRMP